MRILLLLRGAPGCGKSTFIRSHNLQNYTLSSDYIRLLCQSPVLNLDGDPIISQDNDKIMWNTLFNLLEVRMQRGEFTVIDATNSKVKEINRYKNLCENYRYRMSCVDFTDLPIEECKRRNREREKYKFVPEDVIDLMYSRFETQKIPSGITIIKPNELDSIFFAKRDFSEYNKIHVIGDIHGCHTALRQYLDSIGGINEEDFYIFVGDFLDRGLENAEVLSFILSIYEKKNVLLLEGNHERWIWSLANEEVSGSKEFEINTKPQIEKLLNEGLITRKDLKKFYKKLGQCAWFSYLNKDFFICHGGIPSLPENISFLSTYSMIHGVGKYEDYLHVSESWSRNTPENTILIHGHRNTNRSPISIIDNRVYNLEGRVEFGGSLRAVDISRNKKKVIITPIEINNTVFKDPVIFTQEREKVYSNVAETVISLRNNPLIQEKKFGNISSFNFTKKAFFHKKWSEQTITARGLYIDTQEMEVIARGYPKFFNIGEKEETKLDILQERIKFPVCCYLKENGFLGLVSYNKSTDELFFATKSNPESYLCDELKKIFYDTIPEDTIEKIKNHLEGINSTMVFECISPVLDPHIIKYDAPQLVLLDVIKNNIKFSKLSYSDLAKFGNMFGLTVKKRVEEIKNWEDFQTWYEIVNKEDYKYDGSEIEGFVVEDSNGLMLKVKLAFYRFWRYMRYVAQVTFNCGHFPNTASLNTPEANRFYGFIQNLYSLHKENNTLENIPSDIISLRYMYFNSQRDKNA